MMDQTTQLMNQVSDSHELSRHRTEHTPFSNPEKAGFGRSHSFIQSNERNDEWPEYQNERPGLVARYLSRHDTPAQLQPDGEAWRLSGRRTSFKTVIYGLSGVGKSQMCLGMILENEARFRGIFYVDASNRATADSHYLEIARVCRFQNYREGIDLEQQISITRAWLACQKDPWLLMIDNLDSQGPIDPEHPQHPRLDRYVPTGGPGTILITTTDEACAFSGDTSCKIEGMRDEEAIQLLMQCIRPGTILDAEDIQAARDLALKHLGRLPLPIAQAGSYIFNKAITYKEYLDEFQKSPQEPLSYHALLDKWPRPNPAWKTFTLSLSRIENLRKRGAKNAVELPRTLSFLHHEAVPSRLFEVAWNNLKTARSWSKFVKFLDPASTRWDRPDLREALEILCRYGLLKRTPPPARHYSMHTIVHTICRESLATEERREFGLRAASLISVALLGIRAPLSWIEDPSAFDLQKSLLPHINSWVNHGLSLLLNDEFEKSTAEMKVERVVTKDKDTGRLGLTKQKELPPKSDVMTIVPSFAKAYAAVQQFSQAQELLSQIWGTLAVESQAEKCDPTALLVMEQLAVCQTHSGQHAAAMQLRQKILNIQRGQRPSAVGDHCIAMTNLADSLWALGKHEDAFTMAKQTLKIGEETLPSSDPKVLRTRRKVAEYLHGLHKRLDSLDLREQVLKVAESQPRCSDIDTLDLLSSKSALADSYHWDGQLLKALEMREDVYAQRCLLLGLEHPETLLAHDRLMGTKSAWVCDTSEQLEICRLREKSVDTWRRMLGDSHPYTMEAKVNLGHSYSLTGQSVKAIDLQIVVLQIRKIQFDRPSLGADSSAALNYLSSMGNVANLMTKAKSFQSAKAAREDALRIAQEQLGMDHAVTYKLHNHLATFLANRARDRESKQAALAMRLSIIRRQTRVLHRQDASRLKTFALLAVDLADSDLDHSIATRRDLLARQQAVLGHENCETLDNMKSMAISLAIKASQDLTSYSEAILPAERVEEAQIRRLGEDHDLTRDTRIELCCIYSVAGKLQRCRTLEERLDSREASCRSHDSESDASDVCHDLDPETNGQAPSTHAYGYAKRISWRSVRRRKERKYLHFELSSLEPFEHVYYSSSEKYSGESGSETSDAE